MIAFLSGQISAQRAALRVRESRGRYSESVSSYLEESIVRRELTDNFCYYNDKYDSVKGAAEWAQKTLQDHAGDKREKVYTKEQLEYGKTHDPLWNAAQVRDSLITKHFVMLFLGHINFGYQVTISESKRS